MKKLLTVNEVTERLRLSYQTLNRYLNAGTFPQPVNGRKRKLLWTEETIEEWVNRNATPQPAISFARASKRQQDKEFHKRQEAAEKALERHRKHNQ